MSSLTPTAPPPPPSPPDDHVIGGARIVSRPADDRPPPRPAHPFTPGRVALAVGVWLLVTVVGVGLVVYGAGPMLHQREQLRLLDDYRGEVRHAVGEQNAFSETGDVATAPSTGQPVAIVDIPAMHFEQVVVEGVGPEQTRAAPGHVPGTAGPGQPGNSAIVGRRAGFGGAFGHLDELHKGDRILVTTTQGQTVYEVAAMRRVDVTTGKGTIAPTTTTTEPASTTTTVAKGKKAAPAKKKTTASTTTTVPGPEIARKLSTDDLYDPTPDNRLTLVTSDSRLPWSTGRAMVVVATLQGRPFEPTPPNGRTLAADGRHADHDIWAPLTLALVAYVATAAAALFVYRRGRIRTAYLLTAAPLVAATFLMAETIARLLPAWT